MLGEKQRNEPMFYYVRMEDMVPENHLLRLIDKYIDLGFIRGKVKHLYSHTGRPSIDPEILLRILLIGYLYGITSERRLCEDVNMHLHTSLINHRCLMVLLRRIDPYYSFP